MRGSAGPVVVAHGAVPFAVGRSVVAGFSGSSCCHARRRLPSWLDGRWLRGSAGPVVVAHRGGSLCGWAVGGRGIQRVQLLSRTTAAPFSARRVVAGVQRDQLLSRIAGGSLHGSTGDGRRNSTSPVVVTHSSGSFRELTAVVAGIQRVQLLSRTTAAPFRIDDQHSARSASPVVVAHGSCSPPPRTFRAVVSAVSPSPVVVAHREPSFPHPGFPSSPHSPVVVPHCGHLLSSAKTEVSTSSRDREGDRSHRRAVQLLSRTVVTSVSESRLRRFSHVIAGRLVTECGHGGPKRTLLDPLVRPGFGAAGHYSQWPPPLAGRPALG